MLQAMNTGHDGSLTTVHASSPEDALRRIETMALMGGVDLPHAAIREQLRSAVDVVVHVARSGDGHRAVRYVEGRRRTTGELRPLDARLLDELDRGAMRAERLTSLLLVAAVAAWPELGACGRRAADGGGRALARASRPSVRRRAGCRPRAPSSPRTSAPAGRSPRRWRMRADGVPEPIASRLRACGAAAVALGTAAADALRSLGEDDDVRLLTAAVGAAGATRRRPRRAARRPGRAAGRARRPAPRRRGGDRPGAGHGPDGDRPAGCRHWPHSGCSTGRRWQCSRGSPIGWTALATSAGLLRARLAADRTAGRGRAVSLVLLARRRLAAALWCWPRPGAGAARGPFARRTVPAARCGSVRRCGARIPPPRFAGLGRIRGRRSCGPGPCSCSAAGPRRPGADGRPRRACVGARARWASAGCIRMSGCGRPTGGVWTRSSGGRRARST